MKKFIGYGSKEAAEERLYQNGFEVGDPDPKAEQKQRGNFIFDFAGRKVIKVKHSIGIKLLGAVRYLQHYWKFQVIFYNDKGNEVICTR